VYSKLSLEQGSGEVVDKGSIDVLVDSLLEKGTGDSGLEGGVPGTSLARDCGRPATLIPVAPDHRPDFVALGANEEVRAVMSAGNLPTWALEFILYSVDEDRNLHSSIVVSVRNRGFHFFRAKFVTSHVVASSLRQAS
jgi:hypothetical protein